MTRLQDVRWRDTRVLVVSAQPASAEPVVGLLEELGAEPTVLFDALAAVQAAEVRRPQLAVVVPDARGGQRRQVSELVQGLQPHLSLGSVPVPLVLFGAPSVLASLQGTVASAGHPWIRLVPRGDLGRLQRELEAVLVGSRQWTAPGEREEQAESLPAERVAVHASVAGPPVASPTGLEPPPAWQSEMLPAGTPEADRDRATDLPAAAGPILDGSEHDSRPHSGRGTVPVAAPASVAATEPEVSIRAGWSPPGDRGDGARSVAGVVLAVIAAVGLALGGIFAVGRMVADDRAGEGAPAQQATPTTLVPTSSPSSASRPTTTSQTSGSVEAARTPGVPSATANASAVTTPSVPPAIPTIPAATTTRAAGPASPSAPAVAATELGGSVVRTDTRARVSGVTVIAGGPSGTLTTVSDSQGRWRFRDLKSGTYVVVGVSPLFRTQELQVVLPDGVQVDNVDLALTPVSER